MRDERLLNIILAPLVTEKSSRIADKHRHVAFKVRLDATKQEIKAAIAKLFKVEVEGVKTATMKGKRKSFRQMQGKRSDWKKAYVVLKEGHDINFANFEG